MLKSPKPEKKVEMVMPTTMVVEEEEKEEEDEVEEEVQEEEEEVQEVEEAKKVDSEEDNSDEEKTEKEDLTKKVEMKEKEKDEEEDSEEEEVVEVEEEVEEEEVDSEEVLDQDLKKEAKKTEHPPQPLCSSPTYLLDSMTKVSEKYSKTPTWPSKPLTSSRERVEEARDTDLPNSITKVINKKPLQHSTTKKSKEDNSPSKSL